ncbi:type III polyketide synthase [Virgibacillus phasianinus]|uniref:Type III polyketide synthase n=1 Tax=Virgibacillus phasianinus TaxID=2017483 RepID=A0A220U5R1_9BACI|nr:3-oxoacyl-[acyl-carrier-protein] synthase III C-terminal domain-containing protein [Virgibacillus phasianinus]ASK63375.1 type III polyketide synthase [Virgibacillus phasianinus]
MAFVGSVGLGIPKHELYQDEVKQLITNIFPYNEKQLARLMPVYDNALIEKRQLVVEASWFKESHTFKEKNDLYQKYAIDYSLEAMDRCLSNQTNLSDSIPYEAIDTIAFVSSTGIATPSLDAHLINERPFRNDVSRMPLWGLGCAGGASGLSRVFDWITAHPTKTALLVCCELCSLTFQREDSSKSNIVGTALFGDGASAALIIGEDSPYRRYQKKTMPKIVKTSSHIEKDTLSVMGWDVTNDGLGVIFSKSIPSLVNTLWKDHLTQFLSDNQIVKDSIHSYIAHPGGKKVLEAMENVLQLTDDKFRYSYQVLKDHGNVSSATVLYVLHEWMKETVPVQELSILSALGPGFSSELLLLEWGK